MRRRARPISWWKKSLPAVNACRADWHTDGTTGYDFMDQVSAVLHDPQGEAPLTALWADLTGGAKISSEEEHDARRQILRDDLASELNAAAAALHRMARRDLWTRDITLTAIRRALGEFWSFSGLPHLCRARRPHRNRRAGDGTRAWPARAGPCAPPTASCWKRCGLAGG